jgi:hypothetical protein
MRSNLGRHRLLLLLALLALAMSGCTLRTFFGWAANSTYNSPVEREEVEESMNEHWGKE